MNILDSLTGTVRVELIGAEPESSLGLIAEQGVKLHQIHYDGELTVYFYCFQKDRYMIYRICKKRGDTVKFTDVQGHLQWGMNLLRRPVLLSVAALLLCLTLILPTRVLFFRVEGNEMISQLQILEAASQCGIRFGSARREVRSEKMKNALLSVMPELQWAGINTTGCTGIISVRERNMETDRATSTGICHIAAARDGYITDCTIVQGSAMCAPGQVVKKGQILISGYTDCGICVKICKASGEVFAQTEREFYGWMPSTYMIRMDTEKCTRTFSVIFGKNRINLWKGSGISTATCDRIYKEYCMTLPGGHQLPVKLSVETITESHLTAEEISLESAKVLFADFSRSFALGEMIAGTILRQEQSIIQKEGRYELASRFFCEEMIGREITEEVGKINGKSD